MHIENINDKKQCSPIYLFINMGMINDSIVTQIIFKTTRFTKLIEGSLIKSFNNHNLINKHPIAIIMAMNIVA